MPIDLSAVGKFVAFGYTFTTHIDDPDRDPAFWIQPASSLVPGDDPVVLPAGIDAVHVGVEPTLVLSDHLWCATRREVAEAVAGLTVSIDVSAPDAIPVPEAPPTGIDLVPPDQIYKFAPSFRPVRSTLTDVDVAALADRQVETTVDGTSMAIGATDDLRFDPLALVAEVSRYVPLEPNDMIALGEGDSPIVEGPCSVTGRIEGVGALTTRIQHA